VGLSCCSQFSRDVLDVLKVGISSGF
jgi:hypothetical protein